MGPQGSRTLSLPALLFAAPLLAAPFLLATTLHAQVFVVGEKTATADVITEFHPTHVQLPSEPLTERGHLDLLRNLEAEQGFAHRELPLGAGISLQANGNMTPRDEAFKVMLYQKGQSAAPGDRVEISALQFKPDRIILDFNGGPYAKHRFLSHISFNGNPIAQLGPMAYGFRITLVFEGEVPEVTAAEVKALLDPLVDFKARSSAEAFTNTLTPKVRDAVQAHQILVGMDRRMVIAAVGEPKTKHREQVAPEPVPISADPSAPAAERAAVADAPILEEWIYGDPPQPTQFVRFRDGRVTLLKIAAMGMPIEIHDHNELDMTPAPALIARTISNGDAQVDKSEAHERAQPPTLRRPGDHDDDVPTTTLGRVHLPGDTPAPNQPATPAPNQPATPDLIRPASESDGPASGVPAASQPNPATAAPPKLPFVSQPSR